MTTTTDTQVKTLFHVHESRIDQPRPGLASNCGLPYSSCLAILDSFDQATDYVAYWHKAHEKKRLWGWANGFLDGVSTTVLWNSVTRLDIYEKAVTA